MEGHQRRARSERGGGKPRTGSRLGLFSLLDLAHLGVLALLDLALGLVLLLLGRIGFGALDLLGLDLLLPHGALAEVEPAAQVDAALLAEREDRAEEEEDPAREDDGLGLGAREAPQEVVEEAEEDRAPAARRVHALRARSRMASAEYHEGTRQGRRGHAPS